MRALLTTNPKGLAVLLSTTCHLLSFLIDSRREYDSNVIVGFALNLLTKYFE